MFVKLIRRILFFTLPVTLIAGSGIEIENWQTEGEAQVYTSETLWEAINGAAESYVAYDVVQMTLQDIRKDTLLVTVYVYDMGTPLNAFGIFATERSPEEDPVQVGTLGAIYEPYQALLLKDKYYIKLEVFEGELNEKVGMDLLKDVASSFSGSTEIPKQITKLPLKMNHVDWSAQYMKESFLGLSELDECVYARYKLDDENTYRIFHMLSENPDETWNDLAEKNWQLEKADGIKMLARSIPYQGKIGIVMTNSGLFGVADLEENAMVKVLKKLVIK